MKQCFVKIKNKIKSKLANSPTYANFLRTRDKIADRIRVAILAFFDFLSPCWNFLCFATLNPDETNKAGNEYSWVTDHISVIIHTLFLMNLCCTMLTTNMNTEVL